MPTAGTFFAVGIGAGDPLDMTLVPGRRWSTPMPLSPL